MKKESMGRIEKRESFEQPIKNLLVIEDDSENMKAAQGFFKEGEVKVSVDFARDYKTAKKLLEERKYDGVITDLLFPNNIENLDDVSLANEVVKKIKSKLQAEGLKKSIPETPHSFCSVSDTEAERILTGLENLLQGKTIKKDGLRVEYTKKDQPLGVLIAEIARKERIPYVIVTSGHAAHSDLPSPIAAYLALEGLIKYIRGADNIGFARNFDKVPTEDEYIEFDRKKHEEKGREFDDRFAKEDYEKNLYYHSNPLISDVAKNESSVWQAAFRRLSGIAAEQKKVKK